MSQTLQVPVTVPRRVRQALVAGAVAGPLYVCVGTLEAVLSDWVHESRSTFELRHKAAAFKAMSALRGVRADMTLNCGIVHPAAGSVAVEPVGDVEALLEVVAQREVEERPPRRGQLHRRRQPALNDSEVLTPSRTELSALLGVLNDAMLLRIDTVNGATSAVREALRQNIGSTQ